MAEGGRLPWRRQAINNSRGPAADYSTLDKPLPPPPKGVEWKYDAPKREWRLVATSLEEQPKRKYSLEVAETWNPHVGAVQPTLVPVPKKQSAKTSSTKSIQGQRTIHSTAKEQSVVVVDASCSRDDSPSPPTTVAPKQPPVQGQDYLVHTVLPSDTMQGLCLRYKIKPTLLRQVNKFSGSNLLLAPSKLIIPLNGGRSLSDVLVQDITTHEYKLQALVTEFPHLVQTEARAYLEICDWNLEEALKNVEQDEAWEAQHKERVAKNRHRPTVVESTTTAVLHAHVAVPAVMTSSVPNDKSGSTSEFDNQNDSKEKSLLEPLLLKEVELSSRVLC